MMNSFCTLLLSTVYIFNVAQGKYLTIDSDGNATLSAMPVAVELSPTDDGTGRFNQEKILNWVIKPTDGDAKAYTIGYNVADANATAFLYASDRTAAGAGEEGVATLSTTYAEPALAGGLWRIADNTVDLLSQDVALDEAVAYAAPDITMPYATVTLTRNFAEGKWNSLCLPFALTQAEAAAVWGEGTLLAEFIAFTGTTIRFRTCDAVAAGTPCLLRPAHTAADRRYVFAGVATDTWWSADATTLPTVSHDDMDYTGAFSAATVGTGAYVFGGTDKMYRLVSDMAMKGYRAFFTYRGTAQSKQLTWSLDDTVTAIDAMPYAPSAAASADGAAASAPRDIYRPDGTLVRHHATTAEGLQPGIYIMNGMKVVVGK